MNVEHNMQTRLGAYAGFHFGRSCMASAGARAYNEGSGGCAPSRVQGQSPWLEVRGRRSPPEAESYLL